MSQVKKVHIDYMDNPLGLVTLPQLGWVISSDQKNVKQIAYLWQVSSDEKFNDILSESGWVLSDASAHVYISNLELRTGSKYFIRVKIEDNYGEISAWSDVTYFVTGLIEVNPWKASFVTGETEEDAHKSKGTYVKGCFAVNKAVKEAYVYASALGLYNLHLNGNKVGQEVLAPGWTSYHKRLLYQTYDVTDQIVMGVNAIGAHLGAGWYKGLMGLTEQRNNYGDRTAFISQVHIKYMDGSEEVILSDESWKASDSPVIFSEIYDGEIYDGRLEQKGWSKADYDCSSWQRVRKVDYDKKILFNQPGSTIREIETLLPVEIITTPKGEKVIDFGQNMAGWVEVTVEGRAGEIVELDCFEVLDAQGNVYKDNLRKAKQKLKYKCGGHGSERYKPNFTYKGFRYAQIVKYPGAYDKSNFAAHVVHSDMKRTGYFECSNPDLNQLQSNILWGLKSNFLDVPTDCPQRDERLGWTGDAQIFCRTASFLMNTHQFFAKWLKDLAADQTEEGGVTHVVPDILTGVSDDNWLLSQGTHSAAAWSDAAVINPWVLYLTYGDHQIIHDQYASMKAWVDFMTRHAKDGIWEFQLQFGDWVALDAEEGSYFGATPTDLTASAYYAYSSRLLAKMAKAIGNEADYHQYDALSEEVTKGFQKAFFNKDGSMTAMTQTAHIVALYFDLTPEAYLDQTIDGLVQLIDEKDGHLVTGFIGTPYICHALSQNGRIKEAYDLLLKEDLPSWLYQVKMGATTIWEHWDGLKEDGTMWSPGMNSFNHYAYGAIGEWLYRVVAGFEIDEEAPGYKHALIQPLFGGDLDYVDATYDSIYGPLSIRWDIKKELGVLNVTIPHNTSATITLSQAKRIVEADGLVFKLEDNVYKSPAGSGTYRIEFNLKASL